MLRTFSMYVEHIQNNIRAFSTHVEWSKLHRVSFVAHICLHILFLRVEMLHKINSTIFTSLLDTHTFYLHSQPSTHWLVRKYREEEELWIVLLSLFLWCFQHRLFQEVIGVRRDMIGLLGCWCFWWNTLAFFLQLKQVLVPLGALAPQAQAAHAAHAWSLTGLSCPAGSPGLCAAGASGMPCANRVARNSGHICCPRLRSMFHHLIRLHLHNTRSKMRLLRISRKRAEQISHP